MIRVYTKLGCPECDKVKLFLNDNELEYECRMESKENIEKFHGIKITHYPVVLFGNNYIGGFMEAFEYFSDPILCPSTQRFTMFPIRYENIWKLYKKSQASLWIAEEIDLQQDRIDWPKLNKDEQHFIKHVLAFFASSDGIVNENLCENFSRDVQIPEARAFYAFQTYMETVHNETYSLLIDTYIQDPHEKDHLLRAIDTIPCVQQKAQWACTWTSNNVTFQERLIAFICVEGIFFSASFCSLYWLKQKGVMPGLTFSNELISRDEGLHQEMGETLYNSLQVKLPKTKILEIVKSAVECEERFVREALHCSLIGMSAETMVQYVHFITDRILVHLGVGKHYNVSNPYDFMELISVSGKTNFFERRVGEYQKSTAMSEEFSLDAEF